VSPFIGDVKVIKKIFEDDTSLWKDFSGPIESLRIFDRKDITSTDQTSAFTLEIKTKELFNHYRVEAKWDFMILESVNINKIPS
jgi:hypothetical protein